MRWGDWKYFQHRDHPFLFGAKFTTDHQTLLAFLGMFCTPCASRFSHLHLICPGGFEEQDKPLVQVILIHSHVARGGCSRDQMNIQMLFKH